MRVRGEEQLSLLRRADMDGLSMKIAFVQRSEKDVAVSYVDEFRKTLEINLRTCFCKILVFLMVVICKHPLMAGQPLFDSVSSHVN